jgi:hypothetical protein
MRLTFAAVAWIVMAATAIFLFQSEKQLHDTRIATRTFDLHARETAGAIGDLRVAQAAYVAAGQGPAYWIAKVAATSVTASKMIETLAASATNTVSRNAIEEASKALSDFAVVDKRAREYLDSHQELMAADVVFTEGSQTLAAASQQVEAARLAEREAQDSAEAEALKIEASAAAAAAALCALTLLLVVLRPKVVYARVDAEGTPTESDSEPAGGRTELLLRERDTLQTQPVVLPQAAAEPVSRPLPALTTAAGVCTDLARVRDAGDLTKLLGRAADAVDAKGLIVWLGSPAGEDLRPVLAHGYAPQVVAKMPAVPRSGNNAAALAYRTAELQVVKARPGSSDGALVAPLLSPDGCVGALSLELRNGGEASQDVQALAAIIAAQLAAIVGGTQAAQAAEPRAAYK